MNTPQDRYEVIETLGTGATSRVDKARDTLIGRIVALKTFLHGFGSRDLQQQFLREAQIIGGLSHPNIVALYDVGTSKEGAPYLVMEYVEGKTLESVFDSGPLPFPRVAVWAGDLATALGQAHRAKIIHGDVKPANILMTPQGQVKLGDFGVARLSTQGSGSGNLMGTPAYLSPEQILGNSQDSRSDLFSLGIVLYQMSTGIRPFDGDSAVAVCAQIISSAPLPPSHHNPALPPAFDQVVMRCLAKNPADRYATAEELAALVYPFARNSHAEPTRSNPAAARRAKISWWSQPFQQKDMWVAASGLLLLISLVSIVPALRKHLLSSLSASAAVVDPSTVAPTRSTPPESVSPSMNSITSSAVEDPPLTEASARSTKSESPLPRASTPSTSRTSRPPKSPADRGQVSTLTPGSTRDASLGEGSATAPSAAQPPRPVQLASLRIEVVSAIAEETLAVYAGQDVLISTRLDAASLGEPHHFDCLLSPGVHPLRVILYRTDESLHMQKEGFAEIVSDGSNTLDIRVNRRAKLLVRKETVLEVSWPNPHSAKYTSPLAPVSASSE
ncbi:MAG TPA: protein kinase [Candidatus Acidoferrales bacterium]